MGAQRLRHSSNSDIWSLRAQWRSFKPRLQSELRSGRFRFSALRVLRVPGETLELWSALDALGAQSLGAYPDADGGAAVRPALLSSQASRRSEGRGAGGAAQLPSHQFVFRTDVESYYASIDHELLYQLLERNIHEKPVLRLLWGSLRRTVYDGGIIGTSHVAFRSAALSHPLMGALYLQPLDERLERLGVFYARFMDDWVVLAPTRWKLRAAIREVNEVMAGCKVKQHPAKTYIGRVCNGFDFLCYAFSPEGLGVAARSIGHLATHVTRLYEQGADSRRIGDYVQRWLGWWEAGLVANAKKLLLPALARSARCPLEPPGH